ncbi:hypothetical protein GCM10027168_71490 [Streptomyces capparidis]
MLSPCGWSVRVAGPPGRGRAVRGLLLAVRAVTVAAVRPEGQPGGGAAELRRRVAARCRGAPGAWKLPGGQGTGGHGREPKVSPALPIVLPMGL